MPVNILRKYNT